MFFVKNFEMEAKRKIILLHDYFNYFDSWSEWACFRHGIATAVFLLYIMIIFTIPMLC